MVMANIAVWIIFILGIAHIVYGLVAFRAPLRDAAAAGLIGQFKTPDIRRTAFWFLIFGPLMMLTGHVGIHAVGVGDLGSLRIIGIYSFITSLIGVLAMPTSPFWGALLVSPLLIAAGYGLLS